jgi:hypothetical protein
MSTMTGKEAAKLTKLVTDGLQEDGAHHKQWYLEQIAKLLEIDLKEVTYDEGVAP